MTKDNGPMPVGKSAVAEKEEKTLKFWQDQKIFEKSLEQTKNGKEFIFYDGPPFANGLPHYGHVLAGTLKDVVPRYQTMRGKLVRRRWGWDCHGLPAENFVEKELGLKTKKDIVDYGIGKFNAKARESVMRFAGEWRQIIPRLGRFVDMDNDYRTMDWTYTETVWWIFKTLYDKKLIYEGYKAMQICPRCETTLANFEVSQGYTDLTDLAATVKFKLLDEPNTYVLAWTTTPWTLPGNVALAINNDVVYAKFKIKKSKIKVTEQNPKWANEYYIVAKERAEAIFGDYEFEIVEEFKGEYLVGKKYQPLFDYYVNDPKIENKVNGWQIYAGDFVTIEEGTGVVHIAPAFGEDDMTLGKEKNLPFVQHVLMAGKFKPTVTDFAGLDVKPKGNPKETDEKIVAWLKGKDLVWKAEAFTHSYPLCWRCETPLLNYAANSWFVKVTDFRDQLVANNKKINWIPEHIKEGRFGKWLEGARDWAISRARFWGAAIPVWRCAKCEQTKVVGSVAEVKATLPKAKNNYWLMRHGAAEKNGTGEIDAMPDDGNHLTEQGKAEVKAASKKLQGENINLIITSDLNRAKETAEIVAKELGLDAKAVVMDERLREYNPGGQWEGKTWTEYNQASSSLAKLTKAVAGGESLFALRARMMEALEESEQKYEGKDILIISHGLPLFFLRTAVAGLTTSQILSQPIWGDDLVTAEVKALDFIPFPHNENYELELHRPMIDEITFICACGGEMRRVPEVFDCWFESGAMPYGQAHYPFENKNNFDPTKDLGFPADFIAEGLDQTRGWFYSLLVLGTALFGQTPYLNVLVNGTVLGATGQKLSKRFKNYTDPVEIVDRYGADAVRFYLLSSPVVRGEDFDFKDLQLAETYRRVVARLDNVLAFYLTYTDFEERSVRHLVSDNVLDQWILARLTELITITTDSLDKYELDRGARAIDDFIDDLSTWYLRRSRERYKSDDQKDRTQAINTTGYVLRELSKLVAPFMPFLAERVYQAIGGQDQVTSVHLEAWPKVSNKGQVTSNKKILEEMKAVRAACSQALEARSKANIKIRQPLPSLTIKSDLSKTYLDLIATEVNVKQVRVDKNLFETLMLDLTITPELKAEGEVRELIRQIQDGRKAHGLAPSQTVTLTLTVPPDSHWEKFEAEIKRATNTREIIWLKAGPDQTWPSISIKP